MNIKEKILAEFEKFELSLNSRKETKIHAVRMEAIKKLESLELPTRKNEDWKYTNVNFLKEIDFRQDFSPPPIEITHSEIEKYVIKDLNENLLVFVNGVYSEELSRIKYEREEIIIETFANAEKRNAPKLTEYFSKCSSYDYDFFSSLNTAFANHGIYVNVPSGVIIAEPIHIMFINDTRKGPVFSNPRNFFFVGKCSELKIVETYHTIGNHPAFTNLLCEIKMNFSSSVEFNKIQNDEGDSYYIGSTNIKQSNQSIFNSSTISLNGTFIRNNLNIEFAESGSEANINGFYYMKDNSFVDNHTFVDHAKPNCNSSEYYKGILDDEAKAVFSGKVIVRPDAQKTNALQTNRNILLTDEAQINTKPQLEIYADDVKCSHGATTGYLDKESLFYLRARGIGEDMAKALLLNAFASDIIEKIRITGLRDAIKRQVASRLAVDDIYFCDVLDEIVV